jgi:hypothetical protein
VNVDGHRTECEGKSCFSWRYFLLGAWLGWAGMGWDMELYHGFFVFLFNDFRGRQVFGYLLYRH